MAKLKGAAKTAFLKRMAAGRKKAKRKTRTKIRKSVSLKRRKPSKTMAKRRSLKTKMRSVRRRTDLKGIFKRGLLGESVKGIGAGAIGGLVVNQFAPQYATVASTAAGYLGGGFVGALASLFVNGGFSQLTGLLSGGSTNGAVNGGAGV